MWCRLAQIENSKPEAPLVLRQVGKKHKEETDAGAVRSQMEQERERMEQEREQLRQECERRVQEARAAGTREGETQGRNRVAAEMKAAMERLARSVEELAGLKARLRREAEADMIQLSLAIARRVLRRELAVDPEALRGIVTAALEKLQSQEISRVRLHPSHAALVTACLGEAGRRGIEIVGDPAREPGALVFETARGNLDASMDTQLLEIERGLADRLRRRS